jgi:DNA-binding NarL/FixJ family response regulator
VKQVGGPLRVAIVSGRAVIRYGLTKMLKTSGERFEVAAAPVAFDRDGLLSLADVVIYDLIGLADKTGEELGNILKAGRPVLVFELFNRPDVTERALAMGAADAVALDVDIDCLLDTIQRVASGQVLSADQHQAAIHAGLSVRYGLTARETTILSLVAAGLTNQEIARVLYLSINSVKTYIRTGYRKIGARSRSEAVLWATRHSLAATHPRDRTPETPAVGRN